MTQSIYLHKLCRACAGPLQEVLNLGDLRLNAFPQDQAELEKTPTVPLILAVCTSCGLAQLDRTVPPDWMYRTYWYRSGINEMMVEELRDVVTSALRLRPVRPEEAVLDIGANDGTLLSQYQAILGKLRPWRVGVEPATNLQGHLKPHTNVAIHDYFPSPTVRSHRTFAIVTAIAMAYDLEQPLAFFQALAEVLAPDGLAIVQFQDFGQQLTAAAFDNICHEHLEYYTLHSLRALTTKAGLQVVDCEPRAINGGSLRVYLRKPRGGPYTVPERVVAQLLEEARLGLATDMLKTNLQAFRTFARRVEEAKTQIQAVVQQTLDAGAVVDVYGASTKGNILLQVLGLGPQAIRQAIDRSPEKTGRLTITGIPIVDEPVAKQQPANVWLCPIWQFKPSVLARESWYLQQGGQIVFPLPAVEVVQEVWRRTPEKETEDDRDRRQGLPPGAGEDLPAGDGARGVAGGADAATAVPPATAPDQPRYPAGRQPRKRAAARTK